MLDGYEYRKTNERYQHSFGSILGQLPLTQSLSALQSTQEQSHREDGKIGTRSSGNA